MIQPGHMHMLVRQACPEKPGASWPCSTVWCVATLHGSLKHHMYYAKISSIECKGGGCNPRAPVLEEVLEMPTMPTPAPAALSIAILVACCRTSIPYCCLPFMCAETSVLISVVGWLAVFDFRTASAGILMIPWLLPRTWAQRRTFRQSNCG